MPRRPGSIGYFDSDPVTSRELATRFQTVLGTPMLRPKDCKTNIATREGRTLTLTLARVYKGDVFFFAKPI